MVFMYPSTFVEYLKYMSGTSVLHFKTKSEKEIRKAQHGYVQQTWIEEERHNIGRKTWNEMREL